VIIFDVLVYLALARVVVLLLEDGAYAVRGQQSPRRQARAALQAAEAAGKPKPATGAGALDRTEAAVGGYLAGLIEDATSKARAKRRRAVARRKGSEAVDGVFVDADQDGGWYADCDTCGWSSRRYRIEANARAAGAKHTETEHPDQVSEKTKKEANQDTNTSDAATAADSDNEATERPKLTLIPGGAQDDDQAANSADPAPAATATADPQPAGPTSSVVRDDHTYCLEPGCTTCGRDSYSWSCRRCGTSESGYLTEASARAAGQQHTCGGQTAATPGEPKLEYTRCARCGYVWGQPLAPFTCPVCLTDDLEPATVREYDAWQRSGRLTIDDPALRQRAYQSMEANRARLRAELYGKCAHREVLGEGFLDEFCENPNTPGSHYCQAHQSAPDSTTATPVRTTNTKENDVNLEATGPEEIRAAFTAAIETASERSEEISGIAGVLTEAADRYESLDMAASTVGHLRDAGEAFAAAQASLTTAMEELQAALADFNSKDGQVAEAVADAGGNVASKEVLVG
jgi:uncharacterized protein YukE